jgi:hypothetical protein
MSNGTFVIVRSRQAGISTETDKRITDEGSYRRCRSRRGCLQLYERINGSEIGLASVDGAADCSGAIAI